MRTRAVAAGIVSLLIVVALALTSPGCTGTFWINQTAERTGTMDIQFINDTPYRAIFSFGSWNALALKPVGRVDFYQLHLDGWTTTPASVSCLRNFAIGTEALRDRVIDREVYTLSTFDPDAFDTVVHFSDAPAGSDLAAAPTVGTAEGVEKLLGVDYECADVLIFTLVEDPDAEGGFRIDFALIEEEE